MPGPWVAFFWGQSYHLNQLGPRNQKRLIFVLTKVDLVIPQQIADWQQTLGQLAPTFCVQVSWQTKLPGASVM